MQIAIELDLETIIKNACSAERVQPLVDKAIADALKDAISSATNYNSEFRKQLSQQLAEALPHGLSVQDVSKFQHILNQSMNKMVLECNSSGIQLALERAIQDVMPDAPPVIKLSDLLDQARDGFHKDSHEAFYAYYEPSEYGGGWLYLDENEAPGSNRYSSTFAKSRKDACYQAQHRLAFNKEGDVYALRLDGKDLNPSSRPDVIGSFYGTLMAMYVGKTRIEVDIDEDDVEYAAQAKEDY